jgi:hypothetical protein
MTTITLAGDTLICDDQKAVGIIDSKSMKQITSVPLPD